MNVNVNVAVQSGTVK